MITATEVNLYIKFAPIASCESIAKYITNTYRSRYSFMDEADYELEIAEILKRVGSNYNPELGHLIRYAKNTIALKMKGYLARKYKHTEYFEEEVYVSSPLPFSEIQQADLSKYPDEVIQAIYKVITNTNSKKDLNIINKVFKVV